MRILAIGDIHGCHDALQALVTAAGLSPQDLLVTLGDYVDRGPDSAAVLDWLIDHSQTGNLAPLLGNHEWMMMQARHRHVILEDWLMYGGHATLESYRRRGGTGDLDDVPERHWRFIEQCRQWHETESHFFVHANAVADLPLDQQPEEILLWERLIDARPHLSGKTMICGHTPQSSGVPLHLGHAVCIDTWACGKGWLTCLEVETGRYWQANQRRETRTGTLAQPWI